jgi:hypothetical protein
MSGSGLLRAACCHPVVNEPERTAAMFAVFHRRRFEKR